MQLHGMPISESASNKSGSGKKSTTAPIQGQLEITHVHPIARLSKPDSAGRTGISKVIVDTVKAHPGLAVKDLLDMVVAQVPPSEHRRRNARNMIKYAVKQGKITRTDGRYFPSE